MKSGKRKNKSSARNVQRSNTAAAEDVEHLYKRFRQEVSAAVRSSPTELLEAQHRSNEARMPQKRRVLAIGFLVVAALCFLPINLLLPSPPEAAISTEKGSQVNGVKGGRVEASSSVRDTLTLSFATEAHLTGGTREPYAFEVRAPKSSLIDCDRCEQDLVILLSFSGSADGYSYDLAVEDLDGTERETTHISYASASGAAVSATYLENGQPLALDDLPDHQVDDGTMFMIRFDPQVLLSRPADEGWTGPIVRFNVMPREDNAKSSGPFFALAMPNVVTPPSSTAIVVQPAPGEPSIAFGGIPRFRTLFGLIDETGAAQITGVPGSANGWGVNPANYPEGNGPVISYVDHRIQQKQETWRQAWLLLAAASAGAGITLLLERRGRTAQK